MYMIIVMFFDDEERCLTAWKFEENWRRRLVTEDKSTVSTSADNCTQQTLQSHTHAVHTLINRVKHTVTDHARPITVTNSVLCRWPSTTYHCHQLRSVPLTMHDPSLSPTPFCAADHARLITVTNSVLCRWPCTTHHGHQLCSVPLTMHNPSLSPTPFCATDHPRPITVTNSVLCILDHIWVL